MFCLPRGALSTQGHSQGQGRCHKIGGNSKETQGTEIPGPEALRAQISVPLWKWHYQHTLDIKEGRAPTFWAAKRIYLLLALLWDGCKDVCASTFLLIWKFQTLRERDIIKPPPHTDQTTSDTLKWNHLFGLELCKVGQSVLHSHQDLLEKSWFSGSEV